MKIIDGENAILGRLASYAAKESLKGEEIVIVNCDKIIITGNKKNIKENFKIKRGRVGDSQKGPKHSKIDERIVKRTIRGMLPNSREGRGRQAVNKIICYSGIPKKYEDSKKIKSGKQNKGKFIKIKEVSK